MKDNFDVIARRLGRLIELLEQREMGGGGDRDVTINQEVASGDDVGDPDTPEYFSTGATPYLLESTNDFEELDFGFRAETINVRTSSDLILTFAKPATAPKIKIRSSESPFTIGGDSGIDARKVWLKKAKTAAENPEVEVISYR